MMQVCEYRIFKFFPAKTDAILDFIYDYVIT